MIIESIDKTIEVLCERIQKEAETSICIETVPDIVKALAELVSDACIIIHNIGAFCKCFHKNNRK